MSNIILKNVSEEFKLSRDLGVDNTYIEETSNGNFKGTKLLEYNCIRDLKELAANYIKKNDKFDNTGKGQYSSKSVKKVIDQDLVDTYNEKLEKDIKALFPNEKLYESKKAVYDRKVADFKKQNEGTLFEAREITDVGGEDAARVYKYASQLDTEDFNFSDIQEAIEVYNYANNILKGDIKDSLNKKTQLWPIKGKENEISEGKFKLSVQVYGEEIANKIKELKSQNGQNIDKIKTELKIDKESIRLSTGLKKYGEASGENKFTEYYSRVIEKLCEADIVKLD